MAQSEAIEGSNPSRAVPRDDEVSARLSGVGHFVRFALSALCGLASDNTIAILFGRDFWGFLVMGNCPL
jgi:hypothetical protein